MSIYEVSPKTQIKRKVATAAFSPMLRSEVLPNPQTNGLLDFEELLCKDEGHGGMVFLKHFSLLDPLQVIKDVVMKSPVLRRREWIGVSARHQVYPGQMGLGEMLEMKIYKIVTENTIKRARNRGRTPPALNEGGLEFARGAAEKINNGAVLIIAPEGERRTNLEPYPRRTIGRFINTASELGQEIDPDTGCSFIDLRLAGRKEGYWDKNWFNPLNKYEVRIGRALKLGELMERAEGNWRNIDRLAILPEMQRTAAIQNPKRLNRA